MSMSRKLETQNASSSKKAKLEPSTSEVELIEEAPSSANHDLLRCPVCRKFPRKEVYQCFTGHLVCANCLTKLRKCPICQGMYKKVRHDLAEGLLDSMKFQCSWKQFGCPFTQMARKDLTSHEAQCEFNPNSMEFCFMFVKLCCRNKFCPVSTQDSAEMNIFLDHLKSLHGFSVRDVNVLESFTLHFKYDLSRYFLSSGGMLTSGQGRQLWFCRTILRLNSTQTIQAQDRQQLCMVLCRFELVNGQDTFLIKCIRLTEENRKRMSISLCLTGPKKKVVGPSKPRLPELNWTVKPEGIQKLKGFCVETDDLSSYHMIPVVFLNNYLTEQGLPIEFKFTY